MGYRKNDSRNYKTRPDKSRIITSAGWQIVMSSVLEEAEKIICPCKAFILNDIWARLITWYAWASAEIMRGNIPMNHPQLTDFSKYTKYHIDAHKEISKEIFDIMCLLLAPLLEEIRTKAIETLGDDLLPKEKIDKLGYLYYKGIQATIISAFELNKECEKIYNNNTQCSQCAFNKKCPMHDAIATGPKSFKIYFNDIYNLNNGAIKRLNAICKYIKSPKETILIVSFKLYDTIYKDKAINFIKTANKKFKSIKAIDIKNKKLFNELSEIIKKENCKTIEGLT